MMKEENQKVSTFSQILLWFGAAISIAEIITGALLAPLGLI
jgi:purine-cytosine permease-like protein